MYTKVYITGDTHGQNMERFQYDNVGTCWCANDDIETTAVIILGDAGFNFYLNHSEFNRNKRFNDSHKATFYCVRGNHEQRPEYVDGMVSVYDEGVKNNVYYHPDLPRIRYFIDGYVYELLGKKILVIGGAYSVDKYYRLERKYGDMNPHTMSEEKCIRAGWFPKEQLDETEKDIIRQYINNTKEEKYDLVLSHTCPISWQPTDLFLHSINQSTVDNSMEIFLEEVKNKINFNIWLFGHYHTDRLERPHVEMFYTEIENLQYIFERWEKPAPEWWVTKGPQYYWEEEPK